jgi:hypothetical protein
MTSRCEEPARTVVLVCFGNGAPRDGELPVEGVSLWVATRFQRGRKEKGTTIAAAWNAQAVQPLNLPHGHIAFAVCVLQNDLLGPEQQS